MTRDHVVASTRAVLTAGAALALVAAPAAAADHPASGAAAGATAAHPSGAQRNPTPRIRVTDERGAGLVGRRAVYAGTVKRRTPGQRVRLEMRRGSTWRAVDRAHVAADGRFRVSTEIERIGDRPARLRIVSNSHGTGDTEPVERVHGFRRAQASYYGPGLYGSPLACGGTLSPGTIGVANKSLPCGTRLTFRVGERQVEARVIDRGPYVAGREFDLTAATRSRLGFGSTGSVMVDR